MRIKTIFIIVITILLTIVIMQNSEPVYFNVLFFTTRISKLVMMMIVAVLAFIIGFIAGRPKRSHFNSAPTHGYTEHDDNTHEGLQKSSPDTLSDEDRDYIS